MAGEPEMVVFGFALRPCLRWPVRVARIGRDEGEANTRLRPVRDADAEFLAMLICVVELDVQLLALAPPVEWGIARSQCHALDVQFGGVERDGAHGLENRAERMRYDAVYLLALEIEPHGDVNVADVYRAVGGIARAVAWQRERWPIREALADVGFAQQAREIAIT